MACWSTLKLFSVKTLTVDCNSAARPSQRAGRGQHRPRPGFCIHSAQVDFRRAGCEIDCATSPSNPG